MNQELYNYLTQPPVTLVADLTTDEIAEAYRAAVREKIPGHQLVSYEIADEARIRECLDCGEMYIACDAGLTCLECFDLEDEDDDEAEDE